MPVPAPTLVLQPGTTTIVNFPTIAYTTAAAFDRSVTLLGHRVTFHIRPATYTWSWGDGATTTTQGPGLPYDASNPNLAGDITHKYEDTAHHRVSVTVAYTATYDLDGRRVGPVPGTVTQTSAPHDIHAKTYTPVLVGR